MTWTRETTKPGNGILPKKGQKITVHCTGIVQESGKKFWSTKDEGQKPFSFNIGLGSVIPAWDQGCALMSVGECATITATAASAYGSAGFPGSLPPFLLECDAYN